MLLLLLLLLLLLECRCCTPAVNVTPIYTLRDANRGGNYSSRTALVTTMSGGLFALYGRIMPVLCMQSSRR